MWFQMWQGMTRYRLLFCPLGQDPHLSALWFVTDLSSTCGSLVHRSHESQLLNNVEVDLKIIEIPSNRRESN